jgi:hypothetical protein
MKVHLAVCAKDLPEAASGYKASILVSSPSSLVLGTSEACPDVTKDPVWTQLIVSEDVPDDATFTVTVHAPTNADDSNDTGSVVATANFDLPKLQASYYKAQAAFTTEQGDAGAKIALKLQQDVQGGALTVQFKANDLPDTDFGIFRKQHTDGIFEIYDAVTGQKMIRSNCVEDELNPVWDPVTLDLDALCGNNLDAPIRITILDKDKGNTTQYLGQVMLTVNQILGQGEGVLKHYPLIVGGLPGARGSFAVVQATVVPGRCVSRQAKKHLQLVLTALDAQREKLVQDVATKQQAVKVAQQAMTQAQDAVTALQPSLQLAATELHTIQTKLAHCKEQYQQLQTTAATTPATGKFLLTLAARKLEDTDFGLRNKTDPIFEIFINDSNTKLKRSNIVEDDLNPTWEEITLDMELIGTIATPLRIVVSDKDGGKNQTALGATTTSVQALLDMAGKDDLSLPIPPSHGKLYCKAASLSDFVDHVAVAKAYAENDITPVTQASQTAAAAFAKVQADVDAAQTNLAQAKEAWLAAQDQAETAQLALQALEDAA